MFCQKIVRDDTKWVKYLLEIYSGMPNVCVYIKNYHLPRAHQDFLLYTANDIRNLFPTKPNQNVIGSRNIVENASVFRSILGLY